MWQEHIAALYEMHCKLFWGAEFFFMEKSTEKIKKSFNRQQEKTMFLKKIVSSCSDSHPITR
jgi:hypothetical protein